MLVSLAFSFDPWKIWHPLNSGTRSHRYNDCKFKILNELFRFSLVKLLSCKVVVALRCLMGNDIAVASMRTPRGADEFWVDGNRGMLMSWSVSSRDVERFGFRRLSACCCPGRSSPRVWTLAFPSTGSWRNGRHHQGNTSTNKIHQYYFNYLETEVDILIFFFFFYTTHTSARRLW